MKQTNLDGEEGMASCNRVLLPDSGMQFSLISSDDCGKLSFSTSSSTVGVHKGGDMLNTDVMT